MRSVERMELPSSKSLRASRGVSLCQMAQFITDVVGESQRSSHLSDTTQHSYNGVGYHKTVWSADAR